MDEGLRFIKPKKLTPPGSGDLDEWAERRQVENPSTDGGRSSPRRGVDFQPAGRVMPRGRLGWAWLCDRASGYDKLEVRRHGAGGSRCANLS